MPYPESCPECAGAFRNTGTHYTARRNEVGRHVLLELGCQHTGRRFWWDFTMGKLSEDGRSAPRPPAAEAEVVVAAANGHSNGTNGMNGHASTPTVASPAPPAEPAAAELPLLEAISVPPLTGLAGASAARADFVRQLQLDRLTLRQMRGWLLSDEARRAAEVAASATEATYERLALALFGVGLGELLGPSSAAPSSSMTPSAEERLELQREKARIRARQRRAAIKAARLAAANQT